MPPKKQQRGSAGESKTGLVVTLVFFILATLGLGVTTYFGFAEQDTLRKAAGEAKKDEKIFKDERDWYRWQAHVYRLYYEVNAPQGLEQPDTQEKKKQLDAFLKTKAGKVPAPETVKDKDDVAAFLARLDKMMPWDANAKAQPQQTVTTLLQARDARIAELEGRLKQLDTEKKAAEARAKEAEDKSAAEKKDFAAALAKLKDEAENDRKKDREAIATLSKEVDAQNQAKQKEKQDKEDALKKLALADKARIKSDAELTSLKQDNKRLQETTGEMKDRLTALSEKAGVDPKALSAEAMDVKAREALKNWRKDWKVVMMDRSGRMPYINLGSSDKVVPQLTFSIHSVGLDGRLNPTPKGTLEVVQVIGPNLSRARVTSIRDEKADPILKGDMLFNPTWDPTLKKHVAVVGVIDLTGDGRDNTTEFLRMLERQGVVVDYYQDPKDLSMKGRGMTANTDYLIVGDQLDPRTDPRAKDPELSKKMEKEIRATREKAQSNGVTVIGYRRYLDQIGYRATRSSAETGPEGGSMRRSGRY